MKFMWPLLVVLVCVSSRAAEEMHPAAEAKHTTAAPTLSPSPQGKAVARKGAIELTLLVHSKRISVKKDRLWYLIRVRNVGKVKIRLTDETLIRKGVGDSDIHDPLRIEIVDVAGNSPTPLLRLSGPELGAPGDPPFRNPVEREETREPRQGKILEKWLEPGESAETPIWADPEPLYPRKVIRGFKEFTGHASFVPGSYKMRAVYDHSLSDIIVKAGVPARPEDVKIVTPYVTLTVVP